MAPRGISLLWHEQTNGSQGLGRLSSSALGLSVWGLFINIFNIIILLMLYYDFCVAEAGG